MKPAIWWFQECREGPFGADLTDRTSSPSPVKKNRNHTVINDSRNRLIRNQSVKKIRNHKVIIGNLKLSCQEISPSMYSYTF